MLLKISGVEWAQLIENVQWPNADQLVKEEIKGKLAGSIKPSLKYASTERDRQILKLLLYKATSAKFMREGNIDNIKFNKSSLLSESICQYNLQSREKGEL